MKRALAICGAVLGACATAPTATITGSTSVSSRLQSDTTKVLAAYVQAKHNCDQVDSFEARTQSIDPGEKGVTHERWVARGCGRRFPFTVNYAPDGRGSAYIGFAPEQ